MKTLLRIIVIGAILLILVFLSIGVVKVVPRVLSSLASATVSIDSLFGGNSNATSTDNANTGTNGNTNSPIQPNSDSGFIVVGSSTTSTSTKSTGTQATSTSLLDLIKPKFGSYPMNNYVPTPAGQARTSNTSTQTANVSTRACTAGEAPDLAISILNRGTTNASGQYIETNNFTSSDVVTIKFKVENRGACATGPWNFRAEMPSNNSNDQLRVLNSVSSLSAGSAVTGQATFDSPRVGTNNVTLTVTTASGSDSNTSNNTAVSSLTVANTGGTTPINTIGDGRADLEVRILQTGILTGANQFIPTATVNASTGAYGGNFRAGDRVAVRFEVVNNGRTASGLWNFRAELTDYPNKNYVNPQYENSIAPGGRMVYTMAFDSVRIGSNTITIFTDYLNQVSEFNEGNNIANVGFNVNY